MRDGLFECDYAYAITCHKAQGSEWDKVIVADDKMREEDKDFRAKWLYTAVTRAKKKLIVTQ
jgi:exodeoxyribonuclease-5